MAGIGRSFARGARFVVVIGPGGMGKTRLVSEYLASPEWGAGSRSALDPPILFVDAAPIADMASLRGAIAGVLGATAATTDDDEGVASALSARGPVLLAIDNVEQLADALGPSASRWLSGAPDLTLLMTSRVAPSCRGVHLLRLEGLDDDAAAALFTERAAELGVDVGADPDLPRVVRHLAGLPLAIELAAGRTEVMSVRELADRLERSLHVLADQRRGRPDRHLSLQAAFDGSVASLPKARRDALVQCAVFRGSFDLAAAEAVIDTDDDISNVLSELSSRSLLSRTRSGRRAQCIRLLEPLRRLLPEPSAPVRRLHAKHFIERGYALGLKTAGADARAALDELVEIREDLLAAVRFAWKDGRSTAAARGTFALSRVDRYRRSARVAVRHFEQPGVRKDDIEPKVLGEMLIEEALVRRRIGDVDGALSALDRLHELPEILLGSELLVRSRTVRGLVEALAGRLDDAEVTLKHALAEARRVGDREGQGLAFAHLGRLYRVSFRIDDAEHCFGRALEVFDVPSRDQLCALVGQANTRAERGRYREAVEGYERMLVVSDRLGDEGARGCALGNLAVIAHEEGRRDEALDRYAASIEVLSRLGDRVILPIYASSRALLLRELGRAEDAVHAAEEGSRLAREGSRDQILSLATEGALLAGVGMVERADERLGEAEEKADRIDDTNLFETVTLFRTIWRLSSNHPDGYHEAHAAHWEAIHGPARNVRHRLAARLLSQLLEERGERHRCEVAPKDALILDADCGSFRLPGATQPIQLKQEGPVRRLLVALARERRRSPGAYVSGTELVARVWPGERIVARAAKNRLHVALSTLRKAGLKAQIERSADGYRLVPDTPLLFAKG